MKKLLKISVLVGILMFALTMICYADEPTDTATDGGTLPQTDDGAGTTTTTEGSYKALFKSEDDSFINVKLVVEGLPTGKDYRYVVDTNPTASFENGYPQLQATESGAYQATGAEKDLIQLNSDLYIHIFNTDTEHTKLADIKVEKPSFNKLNYFYSASHSTHNNSQFLFTVPYRLDTDTMKRNIHLKIGKITDSDILRSIKNSESEGFAKLKTFAKNDSSPLYDKNQTANVFDGYTTPEAIIPGTSLADGAYYYLYAELDDENGKYIPLESITLTKASVYPTLNYDWYLFFYGDDKFNLDGLDNPISNDDQEDSEQKQEQEEEKSPVLPATGEKALVIALIGITAVVSVILFKKNKGLKIK